MTIDTILNSPDIYVLFDGCPTCKLTSSKYLDECRIRAQKTRRRLHVVPSGSPTATLIRTIATQQGRQIKYPIILTDGTILDSPQDIPADNGRTTK